MSPFLNVYFSFQTHLELLRDSHNPKLLGKNEGYCISELCFSLLPLLDYCRAVKHYKGLYCAVGTIPMLAVALFILA